MKKLVLTMVALVAMSATSFAQYNQYPSNPYGICSTQSSLASLTIVNRSDYTMTVKVMKQYGGLYQIVRLSPHSSNTVSFARSGIFYTKTKAEKDWSSTLYKKGGAFSVQCDDTGYTTGTLEYYISSTGDGSMGQSISRSEFEQD